MFTISRSSTTPGEMLEEEFLKLLGLIQKKLADHIGCDVKVVNITESLFPLSRII